MEKLASTTGDLRYFEPWNSNNTVHSNHSNYITTNSCPTPWRGNKPFKPRNHSPSSSEWPQIFMSRWIIKKNTPAKSYNSQPWNSWFLAPSSESGKIYSEKPPIFRCKPLPLLSGSTVSSKLSGRSPYGNRKKLTIQWGCYQGPGIQGLRGTFLDTKTVLPFGCEGSSLSRNRSWQVRNQSPAPRLRHSKT